MASVVFLIGAEKEREREATRLGRAVYNSVD